VVGDAGGALAVEPLAHDLLPGGDVEHQLPDRVGARHRVGGGRLGGHPGEQLAERRTVPGGALDRPAEQVGEALDLVHRGTPSDRVCRVGASPSCRWLFLDRSRNRSRRWCDMSACGNRAKARRHSRRQRSGR
jgi:hypothetical protein